MVRDFEVPAHVAEQVDLPGVKNYEVPRTHEEVELLAEQLEVLRF